MGACASKCKAVEGKAPQVHEAPVQQTPRVASDTTVFYADQVAADQTPEKATVEEEEAAKEEPAAVPAPEVPTDAVITAEKAEAMTPPEPAIDNKEEEDVEKKIVVEEEKPSAIPIVEEDTATVPEVAEDRPLVAAAVVEVVEENTTEVAIKNVEEEKATQQS